MTIMSITIEIYIKSLVFGRFYDIEIFLYIAAMHLHSVVYKENDIMILKTEVRSKSINSHTTSMLMPSDIYW